MLVDLTLRHWMLLLTTWLLLRISETVRKIVKALEPPVSAAALLGLRSSRKKSAAPTYKAGFSLASLAHAIDRAFVGGAACEQVPSSRKHYVERGPEKEEVPQHRRAWRGGGDGHAQDEEEDLEPPRAQPHRAASAHTRCARAPDCCAPRNRDHTAPRTLVSQGGTSRTPSSS